MPLEIALVTSEEDLDQIVEMDYYGWQSPPNPQLKHFRPVFATKAETLAYVKAREAQQLKEANPNKFRLKVTDTDTGQIIGYAVWMANYPDPSTGGEPTVATWHPEGSDEREFAERFINGLWGFIGKRVTRPHMDLLSLVVAQEHRHRGAGRMLIRWGAAKGDELGIEAVISSLPSAVGAYERSGFGKIDLIPPDESLKVDNPSEKWKELLDDDLTGWLMWRPLGHDYVEGVDKAPWLD